MAGPSPSYQRVPLLPLSSKHSSASALSADPAELAFHPEPAGRRQLGPVPVRTALVWAGVALLWLVSLQVSWRVSWRRAEDAAWMRVYEDEAFGTGGGWGEGRAALAAESGAFAGGGNTTIGDAYNATGAVDRVTCIVNAANTTAPGAVPEWDTLFDIEGPADYSGLAAVCSRTKWVPQRWFSCDLLEGGIGNVRNEVLTCLRYAIDAGASFVLPSLRLRGEVAFGEQDLHTGGRGGLDFYFDVDYVKKTLGEVCSEMGVADTVYDVPGYGLASFPDLVNFKDVYTLATGKPNDPGAAWPGLLNTNATFFAPDMDKAYPLDLTSSTPIIHRFNLSYFEWPTTLDPPLFWHNFGRILKFRPDTIRLAAEVHQNLVGPSRAPFFGIHLRIEKDVGEAWGRFDDLCRDYVNLLLRRPLEVVYLAGGDASGLPRFRAFLAAQHSSIRHRVETKATLLSDVSLRELERMPFDQQAQVDYLVLLLAEFHAGTGASSFTANLGARRHLLTDRKDELFIHYEDDGRTYLRNAASATFMRMAMWP